MGRGRIAFAVAIAASAVIAVPQALAATPRAIYRDYADNGRLDGAYSAAELRHALQDAVVQGYGSPPRQSGVAGAAQLGTGRPTRGLPGAIPATRAVQGQLPFTGLDLWLMALGGGGLLLLGGGLRRVGATP